MITFISGLFNAISSVASLADLVYKFAQAVTSWYVSKSSQDTMQALADAAAASSAAQTDEELANASALWQKALSRPRVTN